MEFGTTEGVSRTIDMEPCHVFSGFRRDDSQSLVEHLGARPVERFACSGRRHSAELFGANRHKNVSVLESPDEFFSFLRPAPVPTARHAQQARTNQNRLGAAANIEEAALALSKVTGHDILVAQRPCGKTDAAIPSETPVSSV